MRSPMLFPDVPDPDENYIEDSCVAMLSFGPWIEKNCFERLPFVCYEGRTHLKPLCCCNYDFRSHTETLFCVYTQIDFLIKIICLSMIIIN